jgi:hypothetical protein
MIDITSYNDSEILELENRVKQKKLALQNMLNQFRSAFPSAENDFINHRIVETLISCSEILNNIEERNSNEGKDN